MLLPPPLLPAAMVASCSRGRLNLDGSEARTQAEMGSRGGTENGRPGSRHGPGVYIDGHTRRGAAARSARRLTKISDLPATNEEGRGPPLDCLKVAIRNPGSGYAVLGQLWRVTLDIRRRNRAGPDRTEEVVNG